MTDPNEAVAILKPLRNAGIRIALDDFGMGYAGLRQLQHMKTLPVDVLKIDKAFVDGLPEKTAIVQAIIQMARSLNLNLIAEGIETESAAPLAVAERVSERPGLPVCPCRPVGCLLNNGTFPALAITQKCNLLLACTGNPAQSS